MNDICNYECPECGLTQKSNPIDYCKLNPDVWIDLFPLDDESQHIDENLNHVYEIYCSESDSFFPNVNNPHYRIEDFEAALRTWCKENDMKPDSLQWIIWHDRDTVAYDGYILSRSISMSKAIHTLERIKRGDTDKLINVYEVE